LSCRCRRAGCTAGDDANEVRARESAVNIAPAGEWPAYGADKAGTKYSSLDQFNRYTIGNLEIAWQKSGMPEDFREMFPVVTGGPRNYQHTPLMSGRSTGISRALVEDRITVDRIQYRPQRAYGDCKSGLEADDARVSD